MAHGDGAAPFRSAWFFGGHQSGRSSLMLNARLDPNDQNEDEGTLWTTWFFGAATGRVYTMTSDGGGMVGPSRGLAA